MKSQRVVAAMTVAGLGLAISACGGGSNPVVAGNPAGNQSGYTVSLLVADVLSIVATHHDSNLVNPWGLAFEPTGPAWVANNGTQTSTLYDGTGAAQSLVVTLAGGLNGSANPTGLVYNGTADFVVGTGSGSGPAVFIYDGEGGTLSGWSGGTGNTTVVAYDDGVGGAVYKGLALACNGGSNFLYATDFHNNKVDVFDRNFTKVAAAGGFADPALPAGYAPFGIQNIQGNLVVTYAQQSLPYRHDEVHGAGLGFVDLFDVGGHLLRRLASGAQLNAPWGIALAPTGFGAFSNALLIGNFGDGRINAYNFSTGAFVGTLNTASGAAITIPGLWAIAFGNGYDSQPASTLFFTAGSNDEADGSYGRIDLQAAGSTTSGKGY